MDEGSSARRCDSWGITRSAAVDAEHPSSRRWRALTTSIGHTPEISDAREGGTRLLNGLPASRMIFALPHHPMPRTRVVVWKT